jgi:hypothetical protein
VSPPRPLHPLVEWLERMLAHSLRFVFAENYNASGSQLLRNEGIRRRFRADQRERTGGGHHSIGGINVVFDQYGNAMQRPARAFRFALLIEGSRRSRERRGSTRSRC